ncbi:MAG: uracil phosphoribosyltransferase [Cyanobacteria bacterium RUI128]|nr:uracil phosphoribosyltransferase [Cyanobacteria bacterium RUI128]
MSNTITYNKDKVRVINNPVICQSLCTMRNKTTDSQGVRIAARKITRVLLYEASKNLPLVDREIETPVAKFTAQDIAEDIKIIISPILRAGLIFTDEAIDILPDACIRHIGMYRDETTLKPVWYYNKVPMATPDPNKFYIYITDPMLATGNSMLEAIRLYAEKKIPIKNIKCISIIAAPEGISLIQKEFPDIEIITAAVDQKLNEKGYIIPGLGDAGDRIFNTVAE